MELSHLSACIRMSLDTLSHAVSVLSFWQKPDWNCQRLYDILPVSGAPVLFCLQRCTERLGGVSPHQSCANTRTPVTGWQSPPLSNRNGIWLLKTLRNILVSEIFVSSHRKQIVFGPTTGVHLQSQLPVAPHPCHKFT